jgi:hypothetical protein
MDPTRLTSMIDAAWEGSILPKLEDYIRIPCKSPGFERNWAETGHLDKAVQLIETWCRAQPIEGLKVEVVRLPGRSPLLFMEIPATDGSSGESVMLYGHYDKQPEMVGWREDLGPWKPVREDDKLYGRGGADDGYSAFASLLAISALRKEGVKHKRCVVLIEGCEESGSFDLPAYLEHLTPRIGDVTLVVCLDSGCGNYDQLWGHDQPAWPGRRDPDGERARPGGALGGRERDRSLELPDRAPPVVAPRGRGDGPRPARGVPRAPTPARPDGRRPRLVGRRAQERDRCTTSFPYVGRHDRRCRPIYTELVLNRTWRPALLDRHRHAAGLPPLDVERRQRAAPQDRR